jgi:pyruvate,orthophosphate dikinase
MGKPCISGSNEINIDYENKIFKSGEYQIKEGDVITIDGGRGKVMLGDVPTVKPDISGDFSKLMSWADRYRKLKVRTNSETSAPKSLAI